MKINGICKWASVIDPNTKFDPKWCINVYPSQEILKKLKSNGFAIKKDDSGDEFIHLKRSCTTRAGKKMEPPMVVGRDGKTPFTDAIGNGSEVNVLFGDYDVSGKKYGYLNGVQVLVHVPYGDSFEDEGEGDDEPAKQQDSDSLFDNEEY